MARRDDIETIFAANLKALREARRLSQAQLAELANLSTTTIYRFEARERWAKPENVNALARALDCSPGRLFSDGAATAVPPELRDLVALAAQACGLKVSR